jgi:sec-independent protein translocase protein TatC
LLRWLPSLIKWFSDQQPSEPRPAFPQLVAEGEGEQKSFVEHLEDLRKMLFRFLGALFIGFNLCLLFANRLLFILEWPLYRVAPKPEQFLQSLNVTDSFVLAMKMSFYGGLLLTAPVLLYFLAQFILPALKRREKDLLVPVCVLGTLLFVLGAAMCFLWIIPQTLKAFIKYSEWLKIEPHWTITSYIEFVTQFMLAMGVTFEVPLVMLILVRLGVLSATTLRRGRKVCVAIAVVISAVVAPPDPLSMVLMSLPLIGLFEATIWIAWWMERRKRQESGESLGLR